MGKIKQRIKKYFTEKPKSEFWMWAFIYLFIFKYLSPIVIYFSLFMMVGLAAPDVDITKATEMASESLIDSFIFLFTTMFELGQGIAIDHPIISKIILFAFANIVWVFYLGFIIMILHLGRYFISWIIRKRNGEKKIKKFA